MDPDRGAWGTKLGFYFAAIGVAFGLGNLWRFPYVVAENGGGAFILLYVLLVFLVGIPLLTTEIIVGKLERKSIISAFNNIDSKRISKKKSNKFKYSAHLSVVMALIILSYFAIISGWVLHYVIQYLFHYFSSHSVNPEQTYTLLKKNGWLQFFLTSAHLLVVGTMVGKEVQDGIEKWIGYVVPLFAVLLCFLSYKSLTQINASDALRYLFYPDFSKLNLSSLGYALGHVCFTLSIGFGAMVTFGSYLREGVYVPMTGFRVSVLDALLSLFGGILIVPLVLNTTAVSSGPEMLFVALPSFLEHISQGSLYGFLFFLCLYMSALGGSIGLFETVVANLKDAYGADRIKSSWRVGFLCTILAMIPVFANNIFFDSHGIDNLIIKNMDLVLVNWILPVVALTVSQFAIRYMESNKVFNEFEDVNQPMSKKMYKHYLFVLKWVIPIVVFSALFLQVLDIIKN